jgi:hypothetical protein
MSICRPCLGIAADCTTPSDLASGIDGAFYSALDFSFIVECSPGCYCPPGLFPQTISILASTIPPVVPPILEPGSPIILRLQGCTSLITRTLDSDSSLDAIAAAAQSMQAEWAGQQSLCTARATPGVNCTPSDSIDVCNDPDTFLCRGVATVVAAGLYCQKLSTVGLTQEQIDAAIAVIKTNLNFNAKNTACGYFNIACSVDYAIGPNPNNGFAVLITNASSTTSFDCTDLTSHHVYGGGIILNQSGAGTVVAPSAVNIPVGSMGGFHGPTSDSVEIFYKGVSIFNYAVGWSQLMTITIGVNCGV